MRGRPHYELRRSGLLTLLVVAALLEAAWTVYLGWRLPRHYVAEDWGVAWVGLDTAQVAMLLCAAWAAWRRRALLVVFTTAAGTLLLVDAWFDVLTARSGDFGQSLSFAIFLEIPWAILLYWVTYRTMRQFTTEDYGGVPVRRLLIPRHVDPANPARDESQW